MSDIERAIDNHTHNGPAKSNWIPYSPATSMPVSEDTEVEVRVELNGEDKGTITGAAGTFNWGRVEPSFGNQIVAYRVITGREKVRKQIEDHISGKKLIDWFNSESADELGVNHPMYPIFMDAIEQATGGKGQRHGGARTPFLEQPWHQIAKHTGFRGLVFQAVKKAQEACGKDDYESFEREMLGSLVYSAMALIHARKYGYSKEVKVDDSKNQ